MIPKIIHYIWLGRGQKPKIFDKCYQSWKKYCPDYEFMLWDESNVDLDKYQYVREAYDAKKYAFASDVIRLQKLYEYGGIYLDIDVELIKPIDELLNQKCFMGFEANNAINPGIICGTEPRNEDILNILNQYEKMKFIEKDGSFNKLTICETVTPYFIKKGLVPNNTKQVIDGATFYPMEYFCPIDYITGKKKKTKNTYSIHWYFASWYSPKQKLKKSLKKFFNIITFGLFGKITNKIHERKYKKENEIHNNSSSL